MFIIETTAYGHGSLDYIKTTINRVTESQAEAPSANEVPYCTCGNCREMPTEVENKCCGKIHCLRERHLFSKYCLDVDYLRQSIRERSDYRAERFEFTNRSLRKASYRQYVLWRYGKLGQGNRRVVPSCIVLAIRRIYPSQDGVYMGYKES